MREKNDDDICFPGDKIPYRPASRNIIVYKNPCLDKRGERKETDGTIFRRIVTGVSLFVMGYARIDVYKRQMQDLIEKEVTSVSKNKNTIPYKRLWISIKLDVKLYGGVVTD